MVAVNGYIAKQYNNVPLTGNLKGRYNFNYYQIIKFRPVISQHFLERREIATKERKK